MKYRSTLIKYPLQPWLSSTTRYTHRVKIKNVASDSATKKPLNTKILVIAARLGVI